MSRIARKNLNASFFHVMSQGINREDIFHNKSYCARYLKLMKESEKIYNVEIIAYCIMSNHVHMLMYADKITELSRFMHKINTKYASYFNWRESRVGYVFRDRFKSEPILDEKYLWQCIKYIHENPVKAHMVNECKEYKFSSYNDYKNEIGVGKNKILREMYGAKNYFSKIEAIDDFCGFIDDKIDKKEIMEEYIRVFLDKHNIIIDDIISDKKLLKELIKILIYNVNVTKKDIGNRFNISLWKISKIIKD
jgi:putative transposase